MITKIKDFKLIKENITSGYFYCKDVDGLDNVINGSVRIIKAQYLDLPGVRVEFTLDDSGFLIRVSDDDTIYFYVNGESQECRFTEFDTQIIIDYIEQCEDLYDYPGIKPVIIDVLNRLALKEENTNENMNKLPMKELWYVQRTDGSILNISTNTNDANKFLDIALKGNGNVFYISVPLEDWNAEKVNPGYIKSWVQRLKQTPVIAESKMPDLYVGNFDLIEKEEDKTEE